MKKFIFFLLFSNIYIITCRKEQSGSIPNVSFYLEIKVSDPLFTPLNSVGGWTYLEGGSRGIIVYRKDISEFVAYDRHCPYQPSNPCGILNVESNNQTMIDTCCGSRFYIWDGSIVNGPATLPPKKYTTAFDGQSLRIWN